MERPDKDLLFKIHDDVLDLIVELPSIRKIRWFYDEGEMVAAITEWPGLSMSQPDQAVLNEVCFTIADRKELIDAVNFFKSQDFEAGFKCTVRHIMYMAMRLLKRHGITRVIFSGVGTPDIQVKGVRTVDRPTPSADQAIDALTHYLKEGKDLDWTSLSTYRAKDKSICFGVKA